MSARTDQAVAELVERMTRALGRPVCTSEWVMADDYRETHRKVRARYRVWRWRCPVCGGGLEDPDLIYRPLAVDSDGRVRCEASGCSPDVIATEVRIKLATQTLLESLGIG